jgi:elongation factor P
LNQEIEVGLETIDGEVIGVVFPDTVMLHVVETQPKMKGQTVTATLKPAIMDNGITVQVPQFISEGDRIKVKTGDRSYVEKV